MDDRAKVATPAGSPEAPATEEDLRIPRIREAHHRLMAQYVEILKRCTGLPFLVEADRRVASAESGLSRLQRLPRKLTVWRPLVRFFVESHIRTRLARLATSYRWEELSTPMEGGSGEHRTWLEQAREGCEEVAKTLVRFPRLRLLSVLSPVVIGFLTAFFQVSSVYEAVPKLLTAPVVALGLSIAVYSLFFLGGAFRYKRELFFPGAALLEKAAGRVALPAEILQAGGSVYSTEGELFLLLGEARPVEAPIDLLANLLLGVSIGAFILATAVAEGDVVGIVAGAAFILGSPFGVWLGWKARRTPGFR